VRQVFAAVQVYVKCESTFSEVEGEFSKQQLGVKAETITQRVKIKGDKSCGRFSVEPWEIFAMSSQVKDDNRKNSSSKTFLAPSNELNHTRIEDLEADAAEVAVEVGEQPSKSKQKKKKKNRQSPQRKKQKSLESESE